MRSWPENLRLDVGCGDNPLGDVNVDIYKTSNPQIRDQKKFYPMPYREIPNFIIADARYLPFPKGTFRKTFCYSVLEHVSDPFKVLAELLRVTHGTIRIYVPHRWSRTAKKPAHINFFNARWFRQAFRKLDVKFFRMEFERWFFPHAYMPIFAIPSGISIEIENIV